MKTLCAQASKKRLSRKASRIFEENDDLWTLDKTISDDVDSVCDRGTESCLPKNLENITYARISSEWMMKVADR